MCIEKKYVEKYKWYYSGIRVRTVGWEAFVSSI
jgi:hypothetical protein